MNVIHVPRRLAISHWGGTETHIIEVARRQNRDGLRATILCPDALSDTAEEEIATVPIRRVPYFYPYLGLKPEATTALDLSGGNMFSFHLMRELMTRPGLDVIHLHTARRIGAIGRWAARRRHVPYVISLHGGLEEAPLADADGGPVAPSSQRLQAHPAHGAFEWGKALGWWVGSRRVLDDAAAIICVGQADHERLSRERPDARVAYLPGGVEATHFTNGDGARFRARWGIPPTARLLLTVGRVHPQKNQALIARILPHLRQAHGDVRLAVVGPVTDEATQTALTEMAGALGNGIITMTGGLPPKGQALVDAYHAADCFVLPSNHEPFGLVVLEAWAATRPVVASRTGGLSGFVQHGVDGLLCPLGEEDAFFNAISLVLGNRTLARSMAMNGRRRALDEFTWDSVTRRLSALYEEVTREHRLRK